MSDITRPTDRPADSAGNGAAMFSTGSTLHTDVPQDVSDSGAAMFAANTRFGPAAAPLASNDSDADDAPQPTNLGSQEGQSPHE